MDHNLEIIPVLNKVDLPAADAGPCQGTDRGCDRARCVEDAIPVSAKTGLNIGELLEAIVERFPPPTGDPRQAAEGAAGRQLVRRLPRRRRPCARRRGRAEKGPDESSMMSPPAPSILSTAIGISVRAGRRPSSARRGRLLHVAASRRSARPRSATPSPTRRNPATEGAGASSPATGGVLRLLPDRLRRLRSAAQGAREAALNDSELLVRDGDLGRARLRLPLRLPRPAAHGDHPASGSSARRIWTWSDRAERHLRGGTRSDGTSSRCTTPSDMPDPTQIDLSKSPRRPRHHGARRLSRRRDEACHRPPRRLQQDRVLRRPRG
jgi:hypothetical protein